MPNRCTYRPSSDQGTDNRNTGHQRVKSYAVATGTAISPRSVTIVVSRPARPRAGPAPSPYARLYAGQEIRMTPPACILIVEDERAVALDLAHRLRQLGYTIAGLATSGIDAITQALAHHPDLVLMDLRLPGSVDGLEAAQFLRTHLNLPVLVVSGATDPTTLVRARQVSPTGVLAKPVEDHDLQSALHKVLTDGPMGRWPHVAV